MDDTTGILKYRKERLGNIQMFNTHKIDKCTTFASFLIMFYMFAKNLIEMNK